MMALSGTAAFAAPAEECTKNAEPGGPGTLTCITTEITETTEFAVSEATEFVET
jgi:hypothetical protein